MRNSSRNCLAPCFSSRGRFARMHLILFLLLGLAAGALARLLVPGREPGGWIVSMLIGIAGSFVGSYVGRVLGWYREGEHAGFLMSTAGAVLLLVVYHAIRKI